MSLPNGFQVLKVEKNLSRKSIQTFISYFCSGEGNWRRRDRGSIFLHLYSFKRQLSKMVKHNQTIRRHFADKLFECVWAIFGVGA